MNAAKPIVFVVALAMIGGMAGLLAHARTIQRLGQPGIKTGPLAGSHNLAVLLPENLPGYTSIEIPEAAMVTNQLPADTSFGQRQYTGDDGFQARAMVVLMGSSRDSIHHPQVCLTSQGWALNDSISHEGQVHVDRPMAYDLPVMRLIGARTETENGQKVQKLAVYVYWFVDSDRYTASHAERGLWTAQDILRKGELDRWAYVAFYTECWPGQQEAVYDRMTKLIAALVPEFQLVPQAAK